MIHGVINIYKERGYTSHDVVAKLRGIVGQRKIGHTGTLDPDAVGVLPVCFGKATKLCDLLTDKSKAYEAVLLLGIETDTQDISGTVLAEKSWEAVTESEAAKCIGEFVGEHAQIPPMYSALKVNGKKLYELAREGKVIERKARKIEIHQIEIVKMELPRITIRVSCSKGTYIRTLCHDIGTELGCGGCMESLVRTKVERFELAESHTLSEVEVMKHKGTLSEWIVPIDEMFGDIPQAVISEEASELAYNGNHIPYPAVQCEEKPKDNQETRLYDSKGIFIGIFRFEKSEERFRIVKMFYEKV